MIPRMRLRLTRVYDDGTTLELELERDVSPDHDYLPELYTDMADSLLESAQMIEHVEDCRANPHLNHSYDPQEGDPDISKTRRFGELIEPGELP